MRIKVVSRKISKFTYWFTVFLISLSSPTTIFALNEEREELYSQSDLLFYDPEVDGGCQEALTESSVSLDMTLPKSTIEALDNLKLKPAIEKNKDRYLYAQEKTGLAWEILAALHYREAGLNPNGSILNGQSLGDSAYTNVDGQTIYPDANKDAVEAAKHYIAQGKGVYNVDPLKTKDAETYGKSALAYNRGYMYKSANEPYTKSPYVMNMLDAEHTNMKWIHADSYYGGKKYNDVEGKTETRPGFLTVLVYISSNSSKNGTSKSSSSNKSTNDGSNVTIIGDSITVRSENDFKEALPKADIHAKVSKQFAGKNASNPTGITILDDLIKDGKLRDIVVFALGTNSSNLTEKQAKSVVEKVGKDKMVIFVTNYSQGAIDFTSNNNILKKLAEKNDNVGLADWNSAVSSDPTKYMDDDVHPKIGDGTKLFVQTIVDQISSKKTTNSTNGCDEATSLTTNGNAVVGKYDGHTYAFPIADATKKNYLHPTSSDYSVLSTLPCGKGNVCHHDYPAVDLGINMKMVTGKAYTAKDFDGSGGLGNMYFYSTGAKVVALTDGKITWYDHYTREVPPAYHSKCGQFQYLGENGKNYWMGHISFDKTKKAGDKFKAGDVIGEIGPPQCAQVTQAHLHINVSPQSANDRSIIDVVDAMYKLLPEK